MENDRILVATAINIDSKSKEITEGVVFDINTGHAYKLTDIPVGEYENFKVYYEYRYEGKELKYDVVEASVYKDYLFEYTTISVLNTINIKNKTYHLVNTKWGNTVWMDAEQLIVYLKRTKFLAKAGAGNWQYDWGRKKIEITKNEHNLDIDNSDFTYKSICKLYQKLVPAIFNHSFREYMKHAYTRDIAITNMIIKHEELKFGDVRYLNYYSGHNQIVEEQDEIVVEYDGHKYLVDIINKFEFDNNIFLNQKVVVHDKYSKFLFSKENTYNLGRNITSKDSAVEIISNLSKVDKYSIYPKLLQDILSVAENRRVKPIKINKRNFILQGVVKTGNRIDGYMVEDINKGLTDYVSKTDVIQLASESKIQDVEVYKSKGNIVLRGVNGFTLSSLAKVHNS